MVDLTIPKIYGDYGLKKNSEDDPFAKSEEAILESTKRFLDERASIRKEADAAKGFGRSTIHAGAGIREEEGILTNLYSQFAQRRTDADLEERRFERGLVQTGVQADIATEARTQAAALQAKSATKQYQRTVGADAADAGIGTQEQQLDQQQSQFEDTLGLQKGQLTGLIDGLETLSAKEQAQRIKEFEANLGLQEGQLTGYINERKTIQREQVEAKIQQDKDALAQQQKQFEDQLGLETGQLVGKLKDPETGAWVTTDQAKTIAAQLGLQEAELLGFLGTAKTLAAQEIEIRSSQFEDQLNLQKGELIGEITIDGEKIDTQRAKEFADQLGVTVAELLGTYGVGADATETLQATQIKAAIEAQKAQITGTFAGADTFAREQYEDTMALRRQELFGGIYDADGDLTQKTLAARDAADRLELSTAELMGFMSTSDGKINTAQVDQFAKRLGLEKTQLLGYFADTDVDGNIIYESDGKTPKTTKLLAYVTAQKTWGYQDAALSGKIRISDGEGGTKEVNTMAYIKNENDFNLARGTLTGIYGDPSSLDPPVTPTKMVNGVEVSNPAYEAFKSVQLKQMDATQGLQDSLNNFKEKQSLDSYYQVVGGVYDSVTGTWGAGKEGDSGYQKGSLALQNDAKIEAINLDYNRKLQQLFGGTINDDGTYNYPPSVVLDGTTYEGEIAAKYKLEEDMEIAKIKEQGAISQENIDKTFMTTLLGNAMGSPTVWDGIATLFGGGDMGEFFMDLLDRTLPKPKPETKTDGEDN